MTKTYDFANLQFSSVIELPADYEVYDFTHGYDPNRVRRSSYGIGRFNEKRPDMYQTELFSGQRNIHVGIDIAAPVGTEVRAFFDGEIFCAAINSAPGDYGPTLITRHELNGTVLYALHGHLSRSSLLNKKAGDRIHRGEVLAWIGDQEENGGWNPHLHFQLSVEEPKICDMPGVVSDHDLEQALKIYLDPRLVLGPLY